MLEQVDWQYASGLERGRARETVRGVPLCRFALRIEDQKDPIRLGRRVIPEFQKFRPISLEGAQHLVWPIAV